MVVKRCVQDSGNAGYPLELAYRYQERLQAPRDYDLEPINERLRADGVENVEDLEMKFRRFAKVLLDNRDQKNAPTPDVDEYWHKSVLDTPRYHEFCNELFGRYVHHKPKLPSDCADDSGHEHT